MNTTNLQHVLGINCAQHVDVKERYSGDHKSWQFQEGVIANKVFRKWRFVEFCVNESIFMFGN